MSVACNNILQYAHREGIHMLRFKPDRSLTIINKGQSEITLVFSFGEIRHVDIPKWLWRVAVFRWLCLIWLGKEN